MSKHTNYAAMYDKRVDEVKEEALVVEEPKKNKIAEAWGNGVMAVVSKEEKIDTPKVLTVTGSPKVRLRSQADASSNVLLILNEGTDVTGLKQVGDWWLIRVGKQEGYMMAKYLK